MTTTERAKLRDAVRAAVAAAEGDLDLAAGVIGLPRATLELLLDEPAWQDESLPVKRTK